MRAFLIAAVLVTGCTRETPDTPPAAPAAASPTAEQDALWKLAPQGVVAGAVISSKGLASLDRAWQRFHELMINAPELALLAAPMEQGLMDTFGSADVKLASLGIATGKGAAVFSAGTHSTLVVFSLADRNKFLSIMHGTKGRDADTIGDYTCKPTRGMYACASPAELLTRIGKEPMGGAMKLAGARGDLEVALQAPGVDPTRFAVSVAVQLERGAFVARGGIQGMPFGIAGKLQPSGKPPIDFGKTAGFAVVNLPPLIAGLPIPSDPLVPGVTLASLVQNIDGPVSLAMWPGTLAFDVRAPVKDIAQARKLVDQCEKLPFAALFAAKLAKGVCHFSEPRYKFDLDAWIEGNLLRVGKQGASPATAMAPTAIANELAQGQWAVALYGRGSWLGEGQLPPLPSGASAITTTLGLRFLTLIDEGGLGVRTDGDVVRFLFSARTVWSNPDDLVAKLLAISPQDIFQGKASATAKQLAASAPSSPFATDYKAGIGGAMLPTLAVGIVASVAIPALMDTAKKTKRTEAQAQLERLAKSAKVYHVEHGAFPKGKVALAPAKRCCQYAGNKCDDASVWKNAIWQQLDMAIDEPQLFRYAYESDGKTFDAKAVGDLDCDGVEIEYVLHGAADADGNVTTTIVPPQPGTD